MRKLTLHDLADQERVWGRTIVAAVTLVAGDNTFVPGQGWTHTRAWSVTNYATDIGSEHDALVIRNEKGEEYVMAIRNNQFDFRGPIPAN